MANEELREQNCSQVIEAGLSCFYQYGIENTRIKVLAERAGVSSRSVSRYFADKESFAVAVMAHYLQKQHDAIERQSARCPAEGMTGLACLRRFLDLFQSELLHKPEAFVLLADTELYLGRRHNADVIRDQLLNFCQMARRVREYLDAGVRDGSITRIRDSRLESKMICQSLVGLMMQVTLAQKMNDYTPEECGAVLSCYIDSLLRGLN